MIVNMLAPLSAARTLHDMIQRDMPEIVMGAIRIRVAGGPDALV